MGILKKNTNGKDLEKQKLKASILAIFVLGFPVRLCSNLISLNIVLTSFGLRF